MTTQDNHSPRKFKVNDRVKRATDFGSLGTVKDLKMEVSQSSAEVREKGLMIVVQWDNGTVSYHGTDSLVAAKD